MIIYNQLFLIADIIISLIDIIVCHNFGLVSACQQPF